ncbi:hypothetical protein [Anaerophilus nitritogenes]|uniref:hypothetical protein n=1 Tax=Anaerophilus nitritogenes TaxID=2498136 RepID=UPI00101CE18E|nr:hypothetical protein [Anaerophilus nitritogenes]
MEKEMLKLILDKLDNIEKEQQEMKKEQQEMRQEQREIRQEQKDMKQEQQNMREEIQCELDQIKKSIKDISSVQNTIKDFVTGAEQLIEQDHKFIQNLKKVVGE